MGKPPAWGTRTLEVVMQRILAFVFGLIGVFNIGVAVFQLPGHPGLGTAAIAVFGLGMLALAIGLCPCEKCEG